MKSMKAGAAKAMTKGALLKAIATEHGWKSFHNCLCWLCLHLGLLTENHLSACLCGWLAPGLDAAETWDGEHTCLLDFLCSNSNKAVQDIRTVLGLHVMLSGDGLQQFTLCHCLRRARLHCLHGSHYEAE